MLVCAQLTKVRIRYWIRCKYFKITMNNLFKKNVCWLKKLLRTVFSVHLIKIACSCQILLYTPSLLRLNYTTTWLSHAFPIRTSAWTCFHCFRFQWHTPQLPQRSHYPSWMEKLLKCTGRCCAGFLPLMSVGIHKFISCDAYHGTSRFGKPRAISSLHVHLLYTL